MSHQRLIAGETRQQSSVRLPGGGRGGRDAVFTVTPERSNPNRQRADGKRSAVVNTLPNCASEPGWQRSDWIPRFENECGRRASRPLHSQRIDFLSANIAGEDCGSVWGDSNLGGRS